MRKNIFGKKLSRNKNQRQALFKNLLVALITYGKIKTTRAKSTAVKGLVDKIVTAAKENSIAKRRFLLSILPRDIVEKLIREVVPRFEARTSGFTRVVKIGTRFSDNAAMVIMEWTDPSRAVTTKKKPEVEKKLTKKIDKSKTVKAKRRSTK